MEADTVTPTPEKPIFAATGDARPRALKLVGRSAAGLVGLWLVALVLGAFGFGHVPGFQLPRIVGNDHPKSEKASLETRKPAHTEPIVASAATRIARSHQVAKRTITRGGPSGGPSTRRHSGSTRNGGGGTGGGHSPSTANTTTVTGNGGTPGNSTSTSTPAASTPAATTSPGNSSTHSNSTNSNSTATPPGSSSTAPGSRSQSSTAPGQTSTTPTPGAGQGNGNGNKPAG